jgi:porphobilinogen synthase
MVPIPVKRPRRLRSGETIRSMVRENHLRTEDLVCPFFVVNGQDKLEPVDSMPGISRFSVDRLIEEVGVAVDLGIPAILLFGIPDQKDSSGSAAWDSSEAVQRACAAVKERYPELVVITDICLCEYTDHGHCGVVDDGKISNDATLELLAKVALSHAQAGADVVAPSDMMDGRVAAIRSALDENGFSDTAIMSYAVKYASAFYGPFRDAAGSAPQFGCRRSYQMDPANMREALREARLDVEEGADILMTKPALSYLDITRTVRDSFDLPLATYNVSGEYSMVKAAAAKGWIDEEKIVLEQLLSMKRAGADIIISYHAKDAASWLQVHRGRFSV